MLQMPFVFKVIFLIFVLNTSVSGECGGEFNQFVENIKKDAPNIINMFQEIPSLLRNLKQSNTININIKKDLDSTQKALERMKIIIIILFMLVISLFLV